MWVESTALFLHALSEHPEFSSHLSEDEKIFLLHRPKPQFEADLASSIAFSLTKNQQSEHVFQAQDIAMCLLQSVLRRAPEYLEGKVVKGFFHLKFLPFGKQEFVKTLLRCEDEAVLSTKPLGLFMPPTSTALFFCKEKPVDWERISRSLLGQGNKREELLLLKESNDDARLMMLALLADGELDVRAFLSQTAGMQNIPWLVRRFEKDIHRIISAFSESSESNNDATLLQIFVGWVEEQIVWARYFYFVSFARERPEEYVRYLLNLLRGFYSFFHRPEFRLAISRRKFKENDNITENIGLLSAIVQTGVKRALSQGVYISD